MFIYLDDNQDSFRELGGNEALLRCLKNYKKLQKDAILKATAKAVDGNSNQITQTTFLTFLMNRGQLRLLQGKWNSENCN